MNSLNKIYVKNNNRVIIEVASSESSDKNFIYSIINLDTNDILISEVVLYVTNEQLKAFYHKASKDDEALCELIRGTQC